MTDPLNAEGVKPWPLFGYAPGSYQCACAICGNTFEGDKRAAMCLECAATAANRVLAATPASTGEAVAWRHKCTGAVIPLKDRDAIIAQFAQEFPDKNLSADFEPLYLAPTEVSALQAQIKALTEERDDGIATVRLLQTQWRKQDEHFSTLLEAAEARATEAERQLAEGVPSVLDRIGVSFVAIFTRTPANGQ